jgi:class 3 adenylate cyclase/TolB-like protein
MANVEGKGARHLRAVLLADIKDYSARMGEDEADAIAGIDDIRGVFQQVVPRHGGFFEVSGGDTFLAIFESAVEAVEAAIEIQRDLAGASRPGTGPPPIRIGIHLGEVVKREFGFMGDSINIAARIQSIAEPGGISISDDIYRAVRNRLRHVTFRDTGPQKLKNVRDPMNVHAVVLRREAPAPGPPGRGAPSVVRTPSVKLSHFRLSRRYVLGAGAVIAVAGLVWGVAPRLVGNGGSIDQRGGTPVSPLRTSPLAVGVMTVRSRGQVPEWMGDFTRDGLITVLSKFPGLRVVSRQMLDFKCERRNIKEMEAAEELKISKLIAVTLSAVDEKLALEVQVIDRETGMLDGSHVEPGSEVAPGSARELIEMQYKAAMDIMQSLNLPVSKAEFAKLLESRTDDRLDDLKLLTESMGVVEDAPASKSPRSEASPMPWLAHIGPRAAWAGSDADGAIRTLLERYRSALESEDMAQVEALHLALPESMRTALHRYFQNAKELKVKFAKVDILVEGEEALATFTRIDDFLDAESGLPVHLEVRVSSVVTLQDGAWKIKGLKKSS